MSKTIDSRVVEMHFDNKDFEKNVKTSLSTIENLNSSLDNLESANALKGLNKSLGSLDLSGLERGVEQINSRFSTLGIIGMTALATITNAAIRAGYTLVNSVISPIRDGGFNRALNLENAKFQLNGILNDAQAVADVMKDVDYGVKDTAYSLDAAAKVAAQLAASGLRSGDQMRYVLRGISGVASMTNAAYEEIGDVYTNVAANGRLMGQDLSRLAARGLNVAAVLGKALNKTEAQIRDMASKGKISFDTFAKAMDDAFGEHSKKANATFEGAMRNMRSALARTGAMFAGPYLENMRDVFNAIRLSVNALNKELGPIAKIAENAMVKLKNLFVNGLLDPISGEVREEVIHIIQIMVETFQTLHKIGSVAFGTISNAFKSVFSGITANHVKLFAMNVEILALRLLTFAKAVAPVAQAAFTMIFKGAQMIGRGISYAIEVIKPFIGLGDALIRFLATFATKFVEFVFGLDRVQGVIGKAADVFKILKTAVAEAIQIIVDKVVVLTNALNHFNFDRIDFSKIFNIESIRTIKEVLTGALEPIKGALTVFSNVLATLSKIIQAVLPPLKSAVSVILDVFKKLVKGVAEVVKSFNFDISRFDITGIAYVAAGFIVFLSVIKRTWAVLKYTGTKIFLMLTTTFSGLWYALFQPLEILRNTLKAVPALLYGFVNTLAALQAQMKAKALKEFAIALAILAGSMLLIASIDETRLKASFAAIIGLTVTLLGALGGLTKLMKAKDLGSAGGIFKAFFDSFLYAIEIPRIIAFAAGILILAAALKTISSIDTDKLGKSFLVLTGVITSFVVAMTILSTRASKISVAASSMLFFGIAIKMLASALKTISKLNPERLTDSFLTLAGLMAGMVGSFLILAKITAPLMVTAGAMLAFAVSIRILAGSLKLIAKIKDLDSGALYVLAGIMVGLVTSMAMLSKIQSTILITAGSMLAFAVSISILAGALKTISKAIANSPLDTVLGFIVVVGGMVIAFEHLSAITAKLAITSMSMIAFSVSIAILAMAMRNISRAVSESPIDTIFGFAIALVGMVTSISMLSRIEAKLAVTAGSMLAFSVSIWILAKAMTNISDAVREAPTDTIFGFAIALVGMVSSIAMLSKIQAKLAITSFSMLAFATSILLLSIAMKKAGDALKDNPTDTIFGFAIAIVGLVAALAMLSKLQTKIAMTSLSMIAFATSVVILAGALKALSSIESGDLFDSAVFMLGFVGGLALLSEMLSVTIPFMAGFATAAAIFSGGILLLALALKVMSSIGTEGVENLSHVITVLLTKLPEWLNLAMNSMIQAALIGAQSLGLILASAVQGIANSIDEIAASMTALIIALFRAVGANTEAIANEGMLMAIKFLNGLTDALANHGEEVTTAFMNLLEQAFVVMSIGSVKFLEVGAHIIFNIVRGLIDGLGNLLAIGAHILWDLITELLILTPETQEVGHQVIQGIIDGLVAWAHDLWDAAVAIGQGIIDVIKFTLGINSPSEEGWNLGMFFDYGMGDGISDNSWYIENAAENAGNAAGDAMQKTIEQRIAEAEARLAAFASGADSRLSSYNSYYSIPNRPSDNHYWNFDTKQWEKAADVYGPQKPGPKREAGYRPGKNTPQRQKNVLNGKEAAGEWKTLEDGTKRFVVAAKDGEKAANSFGAALGNIGGGGGRGGGGAAGATTALSNLSDTIRNQIDIFSEWSHKSEISADKMLNNMRSQIQGVTKWAENMRTLAARGIDQGLLESLAKMGPQGADKVAAFVQMTNEQLAEAGSLYQQSLALPDSAAAYIAGSFGQVGSDITQGLANGMNFATANNAMTTGMNGVLDAGKTAAGTQSPSWKTEQIGRWLVEGLINGIKMREATVITTVNSLGLKLVKTFENVGKQAMEGFARGLENNAGIAEKAAAAAAKKAEKAAEDALLIESPSKLAERRLGRYFVLGFANGINKYAEEPVNAASNMALSIANAVDESMNYVNEIIGSGIDLNPVITPRLDLGGMTTDMEAVNGMFENKRLKISNASLSKEDGGSNSGPTFIQNNYSPKALSRLEIYRHTRNQLAMARGV